MPILYTSTMSYVHSKNNTAAVLWLKLLALMLLMSPSIAVAYSGDVWRDATVYRDEWGIPHVFADNPFAMGFAFGYSQAEDHAEQMLLAYRMANGRLAEVFGEGYADSDAFSLKMGHARLAEEALPHLDAFTLDVCEGFSMGVNAWLVDHSQLVPPWADGMKSSDILALWHAFLMSMAPMDLPDLYRRPPAMGSANAWAVSPERSEEGKAALVINPHQRHDGFFQWYEAHLVLGDINLYGATIRGLPVILQGHNEYLGWALSPNQSDFADIFREEYEQPSRNPKVPRAASDQTEEYHALLLHYMSHSLPYRVRVGTGLETRYVPAFIGARGPMFEHAQLGLHSWYIGGYRDFGGLRQLFEMGAARDLDQFCAALSLHQLPCFHIVYADMTGNIFYLFNTKSGTRIVPSPNQENAQDPVELYQWDQPLSHNIASMAWANIIPTDALPYLFNPLSGFVQACENPPWTATAPPVLNPDAWPPWLVRDRDSYRSKRVRQLLQQGKRSFRDHQSMLFDVVTPAAFDLLPAMLQGVEMRPDLTQAMHPDFWTGIDVLKKWNYVAETSSTGMTFFHLWWTYCTSRASNKYPSPQIFVENALQGTPETQEILLRAVEDAARAMRNGYATLEHAWGEVHRIRRGSRNEPMAGATTGEPIFVASDYEYDRGKWISNYGYGFAMVVQFGEVPESVTLMPFGESNVPDSPHYIDQLDLMLERRFKHARFLRDDILRNAVRGTGKNITLLPQGITGAVTISSTTIIHGRTQTSVEAPYPIPPAFAPFSLYLKVERKPVNALIHITSTIHIPKDLCDDETFNKLKFFRYEPGLDWHLVSNQQIDQAGRNLYMRDDAVAEWYVVLGPAESVPVDGGVTTGQEETDDITEIRGLDSLLNTHNSKHDISGQGRLFEFKRHDMEPSVQSDGEPQLNPENPPRGIFKLEKLEGSASSTENKSDSPLTGIPGFHFGPKANQDEYVPSTEQERVFRLERQDIPEKQSPIPTDQRLPAEEESFPVPPGDVALPEIEETSPAEDPASEQKPAQDAPEAARQEPSSVTDENKGLAKDPPPLPDTIPQDQGFIFGPSKTSPTENKDNNDKKKLFKMEILNN